MVSDAKRGFFHVLDALHNQKEAASQLDTGMSWLRNRQSDEDHAEMLNIQDDMDKLIKRLAVAVSKMVK